MERETSNLVGRLTVASSIAHQTIPERGVVVGHVNHLNFGGHVQPLSLEELVVSDTVNLVRR